MNELIKIETKDGVNSVSAKELYLFLGYDKGQWSRWASKNIDSDSFFVHGVDYQGFDTMSNGNLTKDYALSMDMAKELCMLARNEKGKEARRYFIECEKCGNKEAFYWQIQTRAGDEPMTRFYRCTKCKETWREYD